MLRSVPDASAVADLLAAALSALLIPMMVAAGHDKARSGGLIAAAGARCFWATLRRDVAQVKYSALSPA